ncbi:Rubrerythrin [Methanocella conradii HZ254]|uniref:Rubrerythrin n=1 Tax=Methanocella conradii (strain DSM 24694 / JCM 17849 / CGMCC 1.5162 / HZ254) TaxID=1041930 RepID=H8I6G3_METCZ|nr:rubrerythrin family protein [Methanocella conradii]AFD01161.1 Rubrerythrin [Methanocella conradii HZ254]MDI6897000.1 rubrerythrin family protein [Methanocella conradii]
MKQTIENLTKAFIGESMARNRYTFYASTARKEGYEQIAEVFEITAMNENEHAEWLLKMIGQLKAKATEKYDEVRVEAAAPTVWGTTLENLKAAVAGETYEFTTMYPEFAKVARAEGYKDVAGRLESIAMAERHHGQRFTKLLAEVEAGTVFKKKEPVWWYCRKCGYMHFGTEPPAKCPSCDHERSYYQVMCETF